ncbi:polarized growth protein Boi2 [Dendryphion nanum]|uniref:Polarized growth protein Boi2 n=1 Tax=Dendryphion nanum TaxID=256645 RepID=A0A9P9EFH2_9PLEO|nr:polarized growth protein Boi2 [Dendryphion nanum]
MASRSDTDQARPGDVLVVVHEFQARSPDELSLARGDRIELIERDDDFGDGWFLGRNTATNDSGLFPEVYTRLAPKPTAHAALHQRAPSQPSAQLASLHPESQTSPPLTATSEPAASSRSSGTAPPPYEVADSSDGRASPLPYPGPLPTPQSAPATRTSMSTTTPRSISMTLSGDVPHDDETIGSPVMHETLSVIDEHITDMSTPRHSIVGKDMRNNDSGSEYSSHHRLSYLNGQETDDEEHNLHTTEEVTGWSPAQVAEYLEDVGVEKKHCDIFQEQEINGEVLLGMDQATIFLKEFELGPVGPRLRTWLKIKSLQQEVKAVQEARKNVTSFDGSESPAVDPARNRATSMSAMLPRIPSLNDGQRTGPKPMPRANSSVNPPTSRIEEGPPSVMHTIPASPQPETPTRPSAASVRSLNHNRRHSSIDYAINQPGVAISQPPIPASHKKIPSFDRNWSMGSPQKSPQVDGRRPSSSHNHAYSTSATANDMEKDQAAALSPMTSVDLDRGYFSGNEVDNRKARNVLRKRDSPSHSRNPSNNTEIGRRATYSRRHSRLGSTDSVAESGAPISPAAKAYYGASIKSHRSSSTFEFVRPLKNMHELSPTVTKLDYHSPSIDAVARSPHVPGSETSSQGRASPSPAAHSSFFSKKSRTGGLRAISDAITGTEKANISTGDITASPVKESPIQSPTRTGSSTPSGNSINKSFDEIGDVNKRLTGSSTASGRRKAKKHGTSAYLRGREVITPQEAIAGCDYSGWMKKKSSSLMTTWKTRLFVLRGRRLSYFYTENDTEEKGLIDISSHRVLPANNERITGLHASLTRASSSPSSPQNATIPTAASTDIANGIEEDMSGMFIFKLVPPRAGLQKGVQFTKPIVHYFAVDNIQVGRLWMAALMKATIDRDESQNITTTYQQKTISLEKARAMRQRPPALMDLEDDDNASSNTGKVSKGSIQEDVIQEEDEKHGLAISGLDDAKALLDFAENGEQPKKRSIGENVSPGLLAIG